MNTLLLLQSPVQTQTTMNFPTFTIIAVVLIVAFFLSWYFRHKSQEKERLMLIEQGVDPDELPDNKNFDINLNINWLKIGIVLIAGALGLILTGWLRRLSFNLPSAQMDTLPDTVPLAVLVLMVGIGIIIAHYVGNSSE